MTPLLDRIEQPHDQADDIAPDTAGIGRKIEAIAAQPQQHPLQHVQLADQHQREHDRDGATHVAEQQPHQHCRHQRQRYLNQQAPPDGDAESGRSRSRQASTRTEKR